ncbi:carbon monoxide dehydrogenase subunit G [Spiractinospora alimapuensis]|uniref:SRPBCC family protein n=1 Tax=Spiractinospora alimapuensis TaxID=2820884 RepID=UPI001F29498D|nr:carbon monoxide dehydrogenase subunit G [Spiractinospora alimapuensis]QVQ53685.1 carbon monoxide dehydrogenase subunit G [Spiractinospora alimapuensis]
MRVTGTANVKAPAADVWRALLDPKVLARTIPGAQELEEVGPHQYRGAITAGVASIKGTFDGNVSLTDLVEPSSLVLRASGSGAPGTVQADVSVRLTDNADGTCGVSYDAEAIVGGTISGVGQRVLSAVSKKMAGQFFAALEAEILGTSTRGEPKAAAGASTTEGQATTVVPSAGAVAGVPAAGGWSGDSFVRGILVGAAIALLGVVIGARAARRAFPRPDSRGRES